MTKHPFSQYISSEREEGIATLSAKKNPTKVFVYVEDITDVGFWHGILSPYEKSNNIKFDISPPYSENNLTTGKDQLIKLFPNTDKYFIICLDSDYDYLLQSELAQIINNNPYIFQTYAYAMENLKCYAESLANICVQVTYSTPEDADFVPFLEMYSKIIYGLFIWNLYFYKIKDFNSFSIYDFCRIIKLTENYNIIDSLPYTLLDLKTRIGYKLNDLESQFPNYVQPIKDFAKQLENFGLNDKNTYLFIHGHTLYNNVVLEALKYACRNLKQDIEQKIKLSDAKQSDKTNKLKHYQNLVGKLNNTINIILSRNDKFTDCFLFEKIKYDVENYLDIFKQHTQGLNHV